MEALSSIPDLAATQHSLGGLFLSLGYCTGILLPGVMSLTPLGLKLLDYGYNKVSYVLLFSLYVPGDDRRQGTYYITHVYVIGKRFSPMSV